MLPQSLNEQLKMHLEKIRKVFEKDRAAGVEGVFMPGALERKYPSANIEWKWFWVFPSQTLSPDPNGGKISCDGYAECRIIGITVIQNAEVVSIKQQVLGFTF